MGQPTIVFQPFATQWLGHTSRLIAVAQGVRRLRPGVRSVFLTEGNASILVEAAGFPCINLPHRTEYAGNEWGQWPSAERESLLQSMGRCLLEQLKPSVVVFDSLPLPCIAEETARMKLPAVLVARRTRTAERSLEIAVRWSQMFDLVIAPHDEGEVPVPAEIAGKTHFVGTIVRETRKPAGADDLNPHAKSVVITGGGGGYPGTGDYYNLALEAVRSAATEIPDLNVRLITGPMFREWQKLKTLAGVTVVPFDPDISETFSQADLVICQGGYNTLAEVVPLGKPTICVPAPRVADDQFARARQTAAAHSHVRAFEGTSVETLRELVINALAAGGKPVTAFPSIAELSLGADRAADLILSLCH